MRWSCLEHGLVVVEEVGEVRRHDDGGGADHRRRDAQDQLLKVTLLLRTTIFNLQIYDTYSESSAKITTVRQKFGGAFGR